ncbi:hypothetical protein [Streptomyces sp. NPDC059479]
MAPNAGRIVTGGKGEYGQSGQKPKAQGDPQGNREQRRQADKDAKKKKK